MRSDPIHSGIVLPSGSRFALRVFLFAGLGRMELLAGHAYTKVHCTSELNAITSVTSERLLAGAIITRKQLFLQQNPPVAKPLWFPLLPGRDGRDLPRKPSMRSLLRPAALFLLVGLLALPIRAADSAGSLFKKGRDAEARQKYEDAYALYKQAYDLKPTDLKYRSAVERLRFLAGASHVHRGQSLREEGKLAEAMAEFKAAVDVDPSSFIAQQEIRRTQKLINAAVGGTP